jgi:SPP1 family predicted phage head-tail adaptor
MTQAKALSAGSLRHRVAIDRQDHAQDIDTGAIVTTWAEIAASIPAAVEALSGREYIAAAQIGSKVTARITIRFRADLNAAMRVRHGTTVYRIKAILPDHRSGQEWQTLLVESE